MKVLHHKKQYLHLFSSEKLRGYGKKKSTASGE
jgi:hypothetical protein